MFQNEGVITTRQGSIGATERFLFAYLRLFLFFVLSKYTVLFNHRLNTYRTYLFNQHDGFQNQLLIFYNITKTNIFKNCN